MTAKQIVTDTINHRPCSIVPYSLPFEKEAADKLTSYYGGAEWQEKIRPFFTCCLHINTIQEESINEDLAKDVFGAIWRVSTPGAPIIERPALESSSFKDYVWPDMSKFTDQVHRQSAQAVQYCKDDTEHYMIINMGWGLFEQSWRMRGFENILTDFILEPDFSKELLCRISEYYLEAIKACSDIPADAFFFGDDWGSQRGLIMNPITWREFLKPVWSAIYNEVHRQGKKVISHSCGSVEAIIPDIIEMGMDVLESCQPEALDMNPYELKRKHGERLCFYGGLGNQSTVQFASPDEIKKEVRKLRSEMSKNGGYILAPAKPIQAETPSENAAALFEAFTEDYTL